MPPDAGELEVGDDRIFGDVDLDTLRVHLVLGEQVFDPGR